MGAISEIKTTFICFYICLCIIGCNPNKEGDSSKEGASFSYPAVIEDLNVHSIYDSSMWYMYCFHADLICDPDGTGLPPKDTLTFGETDLRLISADVNDDTLVLYYEFTHQGSPLLYSSIGGEDVLSGMVYNMRTGAIIAVIRHGWYIWYGDFKHEKMTPWRNRPLQADVIQYIKNNKTKISATFYHLAQQRGVFDEKEY